MYPDQLTAPTFSNIKVSVNIILINILILQVIFHIIAFALAKIENDMLFGFIEGVDNFAIDMWLITMLCCLSIWALSKIKKTNDLILLLMFVPPALMVIVSIPRDVTTVGVSLILTVASYYIFSRCFNKQSEIQLEQAAKRQITMR